MPNMNKHGERRSRIKMRGLESVSGLRVIHAEANHDATINLRLYEALYEASYELVPIDQVKQSQILDA